MLIKMLGVVAIFILYLFVNPVIAFGQAGQISGAQITVNTQSINYTPEQKMLISGSFFNGSTPYPQKNIRIYFRDLANKPVGTFDVITNNQGAYAISPTAQSLNLSPGPYNVVASGTISAGNTVSSAPKRITIQPTNNEATVGTGSEGTLETGGDGSTLTELGGPGTVSAGGGSTDFSSVFGNIVAPPQLGKLGTLSGKEAISSVIETIIKLIYMVSGVIFLFMILISGVQWIVSGGNKEAVASAKGRLTWAIIGITVLAMAFLIVRVVSVVTGFQFFTV